MLQCRTELKSLWLLASQTFEHFVFELKGLMYSIEILKNVQIIKINSFMTKL